MTTVLFNTYPVAFDCPGGGEIQLMKTRQYLMQEGVDVLLYDMWAPQFNKANLAHYFSVQGGSLNFCSHVKRLGLPLALSPIIWLGREKDEYPLGEIRELLRIADIVLPNSRLEAEQLASFADIPAQKTAVVCNAVDHVFREKISEKVFKESFDVDYPFVLNVANVEPRKNQLNLIRALKGTGLRLVVLGNIRDRVYYDDCMKEGNDIFHFKGYVEHGSALLRSAYRACEAFVLPSMLETPGLSALEAGASGAKVVITEHGPTKEYFGDMAFYVNPDDPVSIREGMENAMDSPGTDALRRHILSNFTWLHATQQVMDAYNRIL